MIKKGLTALSLWVIWALLFNSATAGTIHPLPMAGRFQALLDRSVSAAGVPGAILAVQTPEGVWIGASGQADLATGQPMTPDLQVRVASVTKTFTAALIMRLVDEGYLNLNDTVAKWLPGQVIGGQTITLPMLLHHTSGLFDHETPDLLFNWPVQPDKSWTAAEVLNIVNAHRIKEQGQFHYCNAGYYILGMIAEAATGDTVEHAIQTRFFAPLGMSRTALSRSGLKTAPFSRDYGWFGNPFYRVFENSGWSLSWDWTAGALVTTAADMLTWTRALFGGQVVSPESLNRMLTDTVPVDESSVYGYGVNIKAHDYFYHEKQISHNGSTPGACAEWEYYPDAQRIIFLALNRTDIALPPDSEPVDSTEVLVSILSGVRDILKAGKVQPAINLLLGD